MEGYSSIKQYSRRLFILRCAQKRDATLINAFEYLHCVQFRQACGYGKKKCTVEDEFKSNSTDSLSTQKSPSLEQDLGVACPCLWLWTTRLCCEVGLASAQPEIAGHLGIKRLFLDHKPKACCGSISAAPREGWCPRSLHVPDYSLFFLLK